MLCALLLALATRVAWMGDDSFITLRTLDNFVNGYGLRWNAAERVQAFTHPLWLFLLAIPYWITREPWLTTLVVSLAVSAWATWLALRHANDLTATFAGLALLSSGAFRDYSTSGLENPLAHLLLAVISIEVSRRVIRPHRIGLLLAAMMLTRLDLVVIAGAMAIVPVARLPDRASRVRCLLGLWPFVLWETFSVVYYGVPFPNTAYAKLATDIALNQRVEQGLRYFGDSLVTDAPTLLLITVAIVAAWTRRGTVEGRAWALGILAYLAYVVTIGGDFMSGRFFTAPFLAAVLLLTTKVKTPSLLLAAPLALVAALPFGASTFPGRLPTPETRAVVAESGIDDERQFYAPETGLFTGSGIRRRPDLSIWQSAVDGWRQHGIRVREIRVVGIPGYLAGPSVHLVDVMALADPLLARLPATSPWRVGHYRREVPEGYLESLTTGENRIADPRTAALWSRVRLVTRGPLWTWARWRAIWEINVERPQIRADSLESSPAGRP